MSFLCFSYFPEKCLQIPASHVTNIVSCPECFFYGVEVKSSDWEVHGLISLAVPRIYRIVACNLFGLVQDAFSAQNGILHTAVNSVEVQKAVDISCNYHVSACKWIVSVLVQ